MPPDDDDALLAELASDDWDTHRLAHARLLTRMDQLARPEAAAWALRLARAAAGRDSDRLRSSIFAGCLPHLVGGGAELPADLDPLVVLASPYESRVRTVLDGIPRARRAAIFAREIPGCEPFDVRRIARMYLDRAPEATELILDYFERLGQPRAPLPDLEHWRAKVPAIDAMIRERERRLGERPFTFVDPTVIRPADYLDLSVQHPGGGGRRPLPGLRSSPRPDDRQRRHEPQLVLGARQLPAPAQRPVVSLPLRGTGAVQTRRNEVWRATTCHRPSRLTQTSVTSISPLRSSPKSVAVCR